MTSPSFPMGTVPDDNYEDTMRSPLPSSMLTKSSISLNPAYSPSSSSPLRFWRPAAQRNIKNQWSKIRLTKDDWVSASSKGRSHATNLVNAYLERKYMPDWNLGVLTDMPQIRGEACNKLSYNQELFRKKLVSSYKDMVVAVKDLVKASCSMRCYLKESGSNPIIQFSDHQGNPNDCGDGGGIPVFSCLSITHFEDLACELVEMFRQELSLKRFLVIALQSVNCGEDEGTDDVFSWSNELYHGEFLDLASSGMPIQDSYPIQPQLKGEEPSDPLNKATIKSTNHKTLEVYLTTWLVDLNIEEQRVIEILCIVEEEMKAKLR
ncbi:hypothetical protein KSP39_PZI012106 [Platanthera zijinensis]|uniref:Uncharacterized protein n=1 Tax=Platanthera zijinensis TaxID=2320716 RepID=A0AAP0BGM6_9ASPA